MNLIIINVFNTFTSILCSKGKYVIGYNPYRIRIVVINKILSNKYYLLYKQDEN